MKTCSQCMVKMVQGFCIENGEAYYCSEKCLLKNMTWKEYMELYDDGEGDSYWTVWELNRCSFCGKEDEANHRYVEGYLILESCEDCEDEIKNGRN